MKDEVKSKDLNILIKHKGVAETSRLFCDKIKYIHDKGYSRHFKSYIFDHHLMFYLKNKLVFKVWLPNKKKDKEFKDVFEALESVGIVFEIDHYGVLKLTRKELEKLELKELEEEDKIEEYSEEVLGKTKPIKDRLKLTRRMFKKKNK